MVQASQAVCVCLRTARTVLCAINLAPSVLIVLISPKQTLFGFDECLWGWLSERLYALLRNNWVHLSLTKCQSV